MIVILQYTILFLIIIAQFLNASIPELPFCAEKNPEGLILVNTIDGKLSVLNHANGQEIWQMETGPGAMLSSSIDRLELTNNGHWVRIIPSLAGNLYKFNGDTIDPIPMTADNLLTASFQYSEDAVIVGGKEIRTYGVTLSSGQLIYECSLTGCVNKTKNNNYEDFVLIERNTYVIRAVESRLGAERWNFSVGQINIKLPQVSCRTDGSNKINFNLKTVVSEGVIYSLSESQKIIWRQKFESPIVNIWTWDGKSLKPYNLFSNTQYSWGLMNINSNIAPALYVGMHNKQLYIQESAIMQKFLSSTKLGSSAELTEIKSISQIPWKPFPATSSALAVVDIDKTISSDTQEEPPTEIMTTALSVLYGSEYINGNGFYLYPNEPVENCSKNSTIEIEEGEEETGEDEEESETPMQVIIVSLWYWWKEVSIIAITTAIAVNLFITQKFYKKYQPTNKYIVVEKHVPVNNYSETLERTISESSDKDFVSRYVTDFNPIQCLGKGGFGIVFEAQNKIDECNYAVKRITLPRKQESRERVMREVKTLAKLEHRNIVRYFNAWLETPPLEWIESFDHKWTSDVISTDGYDFTSGTTPSLMRQRSNSVVININHNTTEKINETEKLYDPSDLKRVETMDSDSFIVFQDDTDKENSTTVEKKQNTDGSQSDSAVSDTTESFELFKQKSKAITSGTVFLYIQMQLCKKESLKDWLLENHSRDINHILSMFQQIVSAVEYVHNNGLIHRDLKPSNIFFSKDGEIKIGDFGLVTESEECEGVETEYFYEDKIDKHTKAVGTQLYMSPEQLKGLSYNSKVDIYSLGIIFFEMLVPFETMMERNKTLLELRQKKFPETFLKNYKQEHELVSAMLSENPDERPTAMHTRCKLSIFEFDNIIVR